MVNTSHMSGSLRSTFVFVWCSEGFGDVSVLGDLRWAGGFGVSADFVTMENSHAAYIMTQDVLVWITKTSSLAPVNSWLIHFSIKKTGKLGRCNLFEISNETMQQNYYSSNYIWWFIYCRKLQDALEKYPRLLRVKKLFQHLAYSKCTSEQENKEQVSRRTTKVKNCHKLPAAHIHGYVR